MRIEKLKTGKSFMNYKHLCKELEMEIKISTNSKNAQFKELQRYCKIKKNGHQITIEEIYDTPQEKIDNRGKSEGSRRSIYFKDIQLLICDLVAQNNGHLSISQSWLLYSIGILNRNYSECSDDVLKLAKYTEMDTKIIYDFYNVNSNTFRKTLGATLNSLKKNKVIDFRIETMVKVFNIDGEYEFPRKATVLEMEIIKECEKKILFELGYEKISQVRVSKNWRKFKNKVKDLLNTNSKIEFYYNIFDIKMNEKLLIENYLLDKTKRTSLKNELNSKVIKNILYKAKIRQENAISGTPKMIKIRSNNSYINNFKKLSILLIHKDTLNIKQELEKIKK
jgi:hypothetical protein